MRHRWFIRFILIGVLLLISGTALAGTQSVQIVGSNGYQLQFITPNTYSSCSNETTSDWIHITNVDPQLQLKGFVSVQYVTDSGRVQVPGGYYPINQNSDLHLQVFYPPVSQWPVLSNGTREIHVDISIEVYYGSVKLNLDIMSGPGTGQRIGALGPYNDWDVFCIGDPPPPPPPPPTGNEGCTPGYWKNHEEDWVGYSPYQGVGVMFVNSNLYGLDTWTLLDALAFKGGNETKDAARILLRAAVAAVLNAEHPDVAYPRTTAEIINSVNAALASGSRSTILTLKDGLDRDNNLGCPL